MTTTNPKLTKAIARDWVGFRESAHFETVMGFLADQSAEGQSIFAEAGWDPYRAAALDARQQVKNLLEYQIKLSTHVLENG